MKLHYSQTEFVSYICEPKFYYLMKLHYSQTCRHKKTQSFVVLLPYEITLFSNKVLFLQMMMLVLLPYEITLFSNSDNFAPIPI